MLSNQRPIYLDYSSTTPVDKRVIEEMIPFLGVEFGNSSSSTHAYGWASSSAVEIARQNVAELVNCDPQEIIWTSGATESNNLAIKGAAQFYQIKGKHIITARTEHSSVLGACKFLESHGFLVTYLSPGNDGVISLSQIRDAIRQDTILVSVMLVNNEIGVIQDIAAISKLCRDFGICFHSDAAQATGKLPIDLSRCDVDMMTFTAHKTYGPKGIGALYLRRRSKIRLEPQMHGGWHELGLRSGTLATHQIVGMGEAFRLARFEMDDDIAKIRLLRNRLYEGIASIEGSYFNGSHNHSVPHILNFSFKDLYGDSLIMALKDIAVSSGSACTSKSIEPSHVLRAIGLCDDLALSAIRFTIGRFTTSDEIELAVSILSSKVKELRRISA